MAVRKYPTATSKVHINTLFVAAWQELEVAVSKLPCVDSYHHMQEVHQQIILHLAALLRICHIVPTDLFNVREPLPKEIPSLWSPRLVVRRNNCDSERYREIDANNLNKPIADLVCPTCEACKAYRDKELSDHPGIFRCRCCGHTFTA